MSKRLKRELEKELSFYRSAGDLDLLGKRIQDQGLRETVFEFLQVSLLVLLPMLAVIVVNLILRSPIRNYHIESQTGIGKFVAFILFFILFNGLNFIFWFGLVLRAIDSFNSKKGASI